MKTCINCNREHKNRRCPYCHHADRADSLTVLMKMDKDSTLYGIKRKANRVRLWQ